MHLEDLQLAVIGPEILVSAAACIILLVELIARPKIRCAYASPLSLITLLVAAAIFISDILKFKFQKSLFFV